MKTESKLWNIFRATHNSQQAQNWKTQYVNIGWERKHFFHVYETEQKTRNDAEKQREV